MSKELNIIEACNMPNGTEFTMVCDVNGQTRTDNVYVDNGDLYFKSSNRNLPCSKCCLEAKFILCKKDKEVPFMKAVKALYEGKTIYSMGDEDSDKNIYTNCTISKDTDGFPIILSEILEYKWYIQEDEGCVSKNCNKGGELYVSHNKSIFQC